MRGTPCTHSHKFRFWRNSPREEARLQHQYEFLSYGLTAAWVILAVYVLMMIGRERKLKREIASLKAMLEEKHGG